MTTSVVDVCVNLSLFLLDYSNVWWLCVTVCLFRKVALHVRISWRMHVTVSFDTASKYSKCFIFTLWKRVYKFCYLHDSYCLVTRKLMYLLFTIFVFWYILSPEYIFTVCVSCCFRVFPCITIFVVVMVYSRQLVSKSIQYWTWDRHSPSVFFRYYRQINTTDIKPYLSLRYIFKWHNQELLLVKLRMITSWAIKKYDLCTFYYRTFPRKIYHITHHLYCYKSEASA